MIEYSLYLESGPRRQKTMVHLLDLLGCTTRGSTTEQALYAVPMAIHDFLSFLKVHGENTDPQAAFTTKIATHIMEGNWLGNGDPTSGFLPDFQPLNVDALYGYQQRLSWMQGSILNMIQDLTPEQLHNKPSDGSRTIAHILEHLAESHAVYLRYLTGSVDDMADRLKIIQSKPSDLPAALINFWGITSARLRSLTPSEREMSVPHGQVTWTARRALRRMLEHSWEHLDEISHRLGKSVA